MTADLELARRLLPLADGLTRYFRAEVDGLDRIPTGAALLVGNHNAGTASPDSFIFASAWLRHNGCSELPVTLGHDLLFRFPGVRSLVRRAGVVPARPGHAHAAFASGHKVLVYPGGQHESVKMLIEVLEPMRLSGDPDDPAQVERLAREVTGEMQSAMDRLVRRLPRSARGRDR